MPPRKDARQRIFDLCIPEPNSGCWLWTGALGNNGYGRIGVGFKNEGTRGTGQAHRVSYETFVGVVPGGMDVCHRCDVRSCVNPDHLFIGTRLDNVHDMMRKKRYWGSKRQPSTRQWNIERRAWDIL